MKATWGPTHGGGQPPKLAFNMRACMSAPHRRATPQHYPHAACACVARRTAERRGRRDEEQPRGPSVRVERHDRVGVGLVRCIPRVPCRQLLLLRRQLLVDWGRYWPHSLCSRAVVRAAAAAGFRAAPLPGDRSAGQGLPSGGRVLDGSRVLLLRRRCCCLQGSGVPRPCSCR